MSYSSPKATWTPSVMMDKYHFIKPSQPIKVSDIDKPDEPQAETPDFIKNFFKNMKQKNTNNYNEKVLKLA